MKIRTTILVFAFGAAGGLALAQYPILDTMADRVVQKYQSSTCEQLWASRT